MKLIYRTAYMNKLASAMGTPDIKVITGIRRCGKSKLLEAFADQIRASFPTANIIRINFNLLEFEPLMQYRALHDYVEKHFVEGCNNVVIIDEVQMCEGFEKAINSLHASEKYDIYITGSNAFLLSNDLSTLFTGRTFEVEVFPFSLATKSHRPTRHWRATCEKEVCQVPIYTLTRELDSSTSPTCSTRSSCGMSGRNTAYATLNSSKGRASSLWTMSATSRR